MLPARLALVNSLIATKFIIKMFHTYEAFIFRWHGQFESTELFLRSWEGITCRTVENRQ